MSQIQQGLAAPMMLSPLGAKGKPWQVLMLVGAFLLFANFFMPWWSITIREADRSDLTPSSMKQLEQTQKELSGIMEENVDWYTNHGVVKEMRAKAKRRSPTRRGMDDDTDGDGDTKAVTIRLWGWNVGTGLMGFLFSFFIAAFVVVPWFVKVVRPWAWTGALASALMMIPMIILGLVWLIGSPGEDAKPLLAQGIIVGPIICLVAALGTAGASVAEGVGGLTAFLKKKA